MRLLHPRGSTLFPYTTLFRSGEQMFFNDRLILLTDEPTMPDITGWSLRDAIELASLLDLEIEHIGKDRKSTRLNSSHVARSYAVFCLHKKKPTGATRTKPDPQ